MHILGIITARGKSKGLSNKHCRTLLGKPLLCYTLQDALSSRYINRLVCTSDSDKILSLARRYTIETIKRPKKYAKDSSSIEEPLRHALIFLKKQSSYQPDIVVLLYGNVPLRQKNLIDNAIALMITKKADAVVSISETQRFHPERLVSCDRSGGFKLYTSSVSSYRRQDLQKIYFIDSGIIAFKPELLFANDPLILSHYFKGYKVLSYVSKGLGAWDVDNDFEFEIAKLLMSEKQKNKVIVL
jgi:CMP-N-acetylneuraminic acid synthetase